MHTTLGNARTEYTLRLCRRRRIDTELADTRARRYCGAVSGVCGREAGDSPERLRERDAATVYNAAG